MIEVAQVMRTVCDLCGSDGAVSVTYAVGDEQAMIVDLCPKCRAPIGRWQDVAKVAPRRKTPHKRFKVTDLPPQP